MFKIVALERWQLKRKDTGEVLLTVDCNEKNTIVIKSEIVIPLAIGKLNNNSTTSVELDVVYENI